MFDTTIVDIDFSVFERLSEILEVKSDRALSLELGLSHSGVSTARKKNTLPYSAIVSTCIKRGISLDKVFALNVVNSAVIDHVSSKDSQPTLVVDDLLAANALVDKVLEELLFTKNLPAERELKICKKLRPMLIRKAFEHNMNEVFVKTIAEGALYMA
ncbi:helix-turn-helix domain-containing protein [Pseudoalteromonas porphyrae]|uniref:Bacteriophage CI repressor N-terminal domain-containing protein n=1 Tax=Pseudoalteromonas porphyrae TaxID=187330 RepID=A0A0N0M0J8_9GAMM|nr:helix-turn-helix domain-containing protein [Pseudoalteromonas porphyrae]KPH64148.1 hypothetical protein ADS77_06985 [Pseudoalteromonas porphyrae]